VCCPRWPTPIQGLCTSDVLPVVDDEDCWFAFQVDITELQVTTAFDPSTPPSPLPPQYKTTALWDTGATKSVITKATADALTLVPISATIVNHAGGSSQANQYLVNFCLPNSVCVAGVLVTERPAITNNAGAIIGMDIISQGDFSITNVEGLTCMTYRIPSIASIDYVSEANRIKYARVGRNDPCPCGKKDRSGKPVKFKKCCAGKTP